MAWRDEYRPGSFRGVPFNLRTSSRTGGRRTVLDEYPLRDKPSTQDMGRSARKFTLLMVVIGADYMARRDQLIEALEAKGPGTLVHPYYGEMQVAVLDGYSCEESTAEGGRATISQTFVESGEEPRPDNKPLQGAQANAAADLVQEEAVSEFQEVWAVAGYASFVAEEAVDVLQEATGYIGSAGGMLSGASGFGSLVGRLTGSFQQLLLSPGNLAGNIIGLIRGMTSTSDPFAAFRAQASLFNLGSKAKPVRSGGYVTKARAQQVANQAAVYRLIERAAAAEAVRLATGRPLDANARPLPGMTYDNRDQAIQVRDQVVAELERQQLVAAAQRYRALAGLSSSLVVELQRSAADLAPLGSYTPQSTMPALLIAHKLYGDAREAQDITIRNRLTHPGFVVGGQPLEVLRNG
ncbi:DNA circularization protein [Pseudomonas sp. F(2018)]|uniref:DNA circularization protein n=1 Tax=Pseudomonas sp. F(2018) TaxID=2502240 RepID=UPI0010F7F9E2|nr:DNA circularization N-terminal domain-containing protein [Pseudomonas sp. F(2018)]